MKILPGKLSPVWVLAIDGTYLRRFGVIIIYWNLTDKNCLFWHLEKSESYDALDLGLKVLARQIGFNLPSGVISDWKGSIVSGVNVHLGVVHQRCLEHVKRDLKRLLPKGSPIRATLELRKIGLCITKIKNHTDKEAWITWLNLWEVFYGEMLVAKSRPENPLTCKRKWWYTHGSLRRAYRILTRDQDRLFVYLDQPQIPKTNNTLEGVNSDLKRRLGDHRGMEPMQQYHFISWYLTFKKVKTKQDLKKLWASWRRR